MIKLFPVYSPIVIMLHLTLAESALELVPKTLWNHPSVVKRAERLGTPIHNIVLDRTYHHRAMFKLRNNHKRGRPDISHFSLLEALGSPLNREGLLKTYVHTFNNYCIYINSEVRLPKNYNRFIGLIEQLFQLQHIPPKGAPLLTLVRSTFQALIKKVAPRYILAFSRIGQPRLLHNLFRTLDTENMMVVVGAFPHGHFSNDVIKTVNEVVSIDSESLEAWTITSRIIYEYEKALGLPFKRLGKR